MSVGLSFEDVFGRKVEDLVPMGLPGGRPLPDDPDGRKPAVAFSVANFNYMVFYLDETHYGAFFPWSININIPIGMDYYVGGKPVGKIYFISQDFSGKNGGFMLMLKRDYSLIKTAKRFKKYLK